VAGSAIRIEVPALLVDFEQSPPFVGWMKCKIPHFGAIARSTLLWNEN